MNKLMASILTEEQKELLKSCYNKQLYQNKKTWLLSKGEETINEYKIKAQQHQRKCANRICDVCDGKVFKNIYIHRKSQKHIQRANNLIVN